MLPGTKESTSNRNPSGESSMKKTVKKPAPDKPPRLSVAVASGGNQVVNTPNLQRDIERLIKKHPGLKQLGHAVTIHAGRTGTHTINLPHNPTYSEIGIESSDLQGSTLRALQTQFEAEQASKVMFNKWLSPTLQAYAAMNIYLREYRRNFLIRGSINTIAYWATKEGFETSVEPPNPEGMTDEELAKFRDEHADLKNFIDRINKKVRFPYKLRVAIIKQKIYGRAGFEIEYDNKGLPIRLLGLDSQLFIGIEPLVDTNWILRGFSFRGMGSSFEQPFYKPNEALFFTNDELEDDWQGLSEIEPVLKEAQLDDKIIREDITEAATTMWAGQMVWLLDRSKLPNLSDGEVQAVMDNHIASIRPGKHIATEDVWKAVPAELRVNLLQLLAVQDAVERRIVGNFGVPRFMLNIEKQLNRATAYAELEAFVDGPITDLQTTLKGKIESQWYDLLTRIFFKAKPDTPLETLPAHVSHNWNEIRTTDWFQLITSVSAAYGAGWIDQEKAFEMMHDGQKTDFDPDQLKDDLTGEVKHQLPPHAQNPGGSTGFNRAPGLLPMPPMLADSTASTKATSQERGLKHQLRGILVKVRQGNLTEAHALVQAGKLIENHEQRVRDASLQELQAQTGMKLDSVPPEVAHHLRTWHDETMKAFQLVLADAKKA